MKKLFLFLFVWLIAIAYFHVPVKLLLISYFQIKIKEHEVIQKATNMNMTFICLNLMVQFMEYILMHWSNALCCHTYLLHLNIIFNQLNVISDKLKIYHVLK